MLRLTYAPVGDIEGVEIRLVEVRFVLWLNPRGHGVVVVVVVVGSRVPRRLVKLLQGNLEDVEQRPYQHVCQVQVTPEPFPATMRQYWKFEEAKSKTLQR
jgi:hypothetical protein